MPILIFQIHKREPISIGIFPVGWNSTWKVIFGKKNNSIADVEFTNIVVINLMLFLLHKKQTRGKNVKAKKKIVSLETEMHKIGIHIQWKLNVFFAVVVVVA